LIEILSKTSKRIILKKKIVNLEAESRLDEDDLITKTLGTFMLT